MGRIYVNHRIVVRDQSDNIISDQPARDMASARPVYDETLAALLDGQTVTLQHGARIILKSY